MLFDSLFSGIGDIFGGLFGNSNGSPLQGIIDPSAWWEQFKNGKTNETNKEIAEENLSYQRERNEIEDARYEEETGYNRAFAEEERDYQRAFAENEREYNRALQQELFNREDTAQLRQASQLSALGINPLSQQLNGANAGQVVGGATAPSFVQPSNSARGGSALHNDFKMQDMGVLQALAPLASLANTINQVSTGQGQRDLLALQGDKQLLENMVYANEHGIQFYSPSRIGLNKKNNIFNGYDSDYWDNMNGSAGYGNLKTKRDYEFQKENNMFDSQPDFAKKMNYLVSDDFFKTAERALTKGSQLFDKSLNQGLNENKNYEFNPFSKFLNLFF